jgi:hypothetical protein
MTMHVITADFNNADRLGRLRLNLIGSTRDFARLGIRLEEGLRLVVRDDDLEADGELVYSPEEHIWVAKIDWKAIRRLA